VSQVPFLAGLVSLLPLGLGSWEAAVVWVLSLYGYGPSVGAAVAVLLRAGMTVPSLAAGAVALGWLRTRPRTRASDSALAVSQTSSELSEYPEQPWRP
jgi:uncharacterized membrane protein YbhN (UPF0104 family)